MSYDYNKRHRAILKQQFIDALGGKCWKCGYNQCNAALDFHHIDKNDKEFTIASKITGGYSLERLIEEAKKCALLCCRCHRELHVNLWKIDEVTRIPFNEEIFRKSVEYIKCKYCRTETPKTYSRKIYCSQECQRLGKRQNWPSSEVLAELLITHKKTQIAKIYNVTETSVRKWAKAYGIDTPRAYSRRLK